MITPEGALNAFRLEVQQFLDDRHWRFVLTDANGRFLGDHTVSLDASVAEYRAVLDLDSYLEHYAAPALWLQDQTRLMMDIGIWFANKLLGPIGKILLDQGTPRVLRVVVPPEAGAVLHLPLEAAWLNGRPLPLQGVSIVYEVDGEFRAANLQPITNQLRVLAMFSLPIDESPLALRRERHALKRLIGRIAASNRLHIELRVLQYGVTREELSRHIEDGGGWDIIHFSGHGGSGVLALENRDSTTDLIGSNDLVELLEPTRGRLKLVTLSACLSAARPDVTFRELGLTASQNSLPSPIQNGAHLSDSPPALARELARDLDCAVVAMRYPVVDEFAIKLVSGLYERMLGYQQPLTQALRLALRASIPTTATEEVPPFRSRRRRYSGVAQPI